MISHLVFCPDEGENLFGSSSKLVCYLRQVHEVVDMGESTLVLQTILSPLDYITDRNGSLMVTLYLYTADLTYLADSSAGTSGDGRRFGVWS